MGGKLIVFIRLKTDGEVLNLNFVKYIEYDKYMKAMVITTTDKSFIHYCSVEEYEEFLTKIDALGGIIK